MTTYDLPPWDGDPSPHQVLEAVCTECGETFHPSDPTDLDHYYAADGEPCDGIGVLVADEGDEQP